ncbi:MAG TPA: pilus assembly protein PilM [Candidatus Tumulicola sp.]
MTEALPFGIDVGSSAVRVAAVRRDRDGRNRLEAVARRDVELSKDHAGRDAEVETAIAECVNELGRCRKTCVLAVPSTEAVVRTIALPSMSAAERQRAASFEAVRLAPWDTSTIPTEVRLTQIGRSDRYHVGIVPRDRLSRLLQLGKRTRLRTVAIDYEPFAALRAVVACDAVLDVGYQSSRLYGSHGESLVVLDAPVGGASVTRAIESDLSVDRAAAERRKRSVGTAGAGERAFESLVARICTLVDRLRETGTIETVGVIGNGIRLLGFEERLSTAAGVGVDARTTYACSHDDDAGASTDPMDWALAAGLAAWPHR